MDAARFISSVSPNIPWHVTAFRKNYKMTSPDNTTAEMLTRAAEIGQEAGLNYVYAGNLPGRVGEYEHTFCSACGERMIERLGYVILGYRITDEGTCSKCGNVIAGIWPRSASDVHLGSVDDIFYRRPRLVRS